MLPATILLAQLHCSPNASGNVDCFDAQKGGAPVLKVEPNLRGEGLGVGLVARLRLEGVAVFRYSFAFLVSSSVPNCDTPLPVHPETRIEVSPLTAQADLREASRGRNERPA